MNIIVCDDNERDRGILISLLQKYGREHGRCFEIAQYCSGTKLCADDAVWVRQSRQHGIGLRNVKAVVEKYAGDLVISCDEREFWVVVML